MISDVKVTWYQSGCNYEKIVKGAKLIDIVDGRLEFKDSECRVICEFNAGIWLFYEVVE